jgi:deoxyribonuclease-1-like protein
MKKLLSIILILFSTATLAETISLASWNIRNISSNSRSDAELGLISVVLARYDFIAIQEIRTDTKALDRLVRILKDEFRLDYSYVASKKVGNSSRTEIYAFLYKTDLVKYTEDSAFVYLDVNDDFIREPYCASFIAGQFDFSICTIHTEFGDGKTEPRKEVKVLDDVYRAVTKESRRDVLIVGDFNLPANDEAWNDIESLDNFEPAIPLNTPTTIADKSFYDNIWYTKYSDEVQKESGAVFEFDEMIYTQAMRKEASRQVSDHRPVSVEIKID